MKLFQKFLYLGIINDTGNFRHKNVTANTFYCAHKLCENNIDTNFIYNTLFSKSKLKAKIFGFVLFITINMLKNINLHIFYISKRWNQKFKCYIWWFRWNIWTLLSIEDVDVALFLREENKNILKEVSDLKK